MSIDGLLAACGIAALMAVAVAPVGAAAAEADPVLLRAFDQGVTDSLVAFGDDLYFGAGDDLVLWRSDGTEDGTEQVSTEIQPAAGGDSASLVSGGFLYLNAWDGVSYDLWRTNGIDTERAVDGGLCPGCQADPRGLTEFQGGLYFGAVSTRAGLNFGDGRQLIRYDPVGRAVEAVGTSVRGSPAVSGERLYVVDSDRKLQRVDGSDIAEIAVDGWSRVDADDLRVVGSWLYYTMEDADRDRQVWRTDGTAAEQVTFIERREPDERVRMELLFVAEDRLFFEVDDDGEALVLWTLTAGGDGPRSLEADPIGGVRQGPFASGEFAAFGGAVYFSAFRPGPFAPGAGRQLWTSDGTVAGTRIVEDLGRIRVGTQFGQPTFNDPEPRFLTSFEGALYFAAFVQAEDGEYGQGRHLFRTQGTAIEFVAEVDGSVRQIGTAGGDLFFASALGTEPPAGLWVLTGSGSVLPPPGDDDPEPGDDGPEPGDADPSLGDSDPEPGDGDPSPGDSDPEAEDSPVEIIRETVTVTDAPTGTAAVELARTGQSAGALAGFALMLMASGLLLLRRGRRVADQTPADGLR